ncbi:MAG: hypothetical protein ABSA16_09225 [Thermoguttaceae bacterium]|jgi:hypothetical protein
MSTDQFNELLNVWGQIKDWPEDMRVSLASRILSSLQNEPTSPCKTLADLVGVLSGVQPPPTDQDVSRIVEEERIKKFG